MRRLLYTALIAIIAFTACTPRHTESLDPAFAKYVSAYTGGAIQEATPIRIELATPVPMEKQAQGLFHFKPSLTGTERWLSPTLVEFVPDALKEGTVYEGSFQVGKVLDVKESQCQAFPFQIQAAPKTATLTLDGISIQDGASLQGSIKLSVPAAKEDIILTVRPETPVTITGEGTLFSFQTGNITRSNEDTPVSVSLEIDGFRDTKPIKTLIPAAGSFKVIDARIVRDGNPHADVRFSEPLAASAAREGLIELSGAIRQTIDIDGNCARIYFEAEPRKDLILTVHRGVKSENSAAAPAEIIHTETAGMISRLPRNDIRFT